MPGYKSRKNLRKSKKKSKTGGRRRKNTVKKVRRGRKVMRGGEPSPKLTLGEIFALLGEKDPDALETFKTLFSKNYRETMYYPYKDNTKVYNDDTLEKNPSWRFVGGTLFSNSPEQGKQWMYRVEDIIQKFPKFPTIVEDSTGYTNIVKIYSDDTLATTLAPEKLNNVKRIFEQYQKDTPYSNDVILRLFKNLTDKGDIGLRNNLLSAVQAAAKLPEDCFVTMSKPYLGSPKPEFSIDKLKSLLNEKEDLKKHFTDAIKNELTIEATKSSEEHRTLWNAIRYMD